MNDFSDGLFCKKPFVSVSVMEFPDFSSIPTGDFSKVPGNPGNAFNITGITKAAGLLQTSCCFSACLAGCKFRGEGDLVVLCLFKDLNDKIGQRFFVWL